MTTWSQFADIFRTRFKDEVADPNSIDFVIDNEAEQKADGSSFGADDEWCRLTIVQGDSRQRSMGTLRRFRTVGVAFVQIHVPLNCGDARARALADLVKAAFQGVTVSGVVFQMPSLGKGSRQAQWWHVTVSIPFRFDEMA